MMGAGATARLLAIVGVVLAAQGTGFGQIHLPGGITIGDPRQNTRPKPEARPERPDPDRVCPKTIEWVGVLQQEYPAVDLSHIMASRVQQMAVPLFADDTFQKEFGVSYLKLSDADRREFFRMHLIPCTNARVYGPQMTVLQVFNPPFTAGAASSAGPLSPGQLIPALTRLADARSTLRSDEQSLKAAPPSPQSYEQATGLLDKRKDELARVWPSEKARLQGAVKDAVGRSAGAAIGAKIEPLLNAPASPQVVRQLRDAPRTYAALLQALPEEQRTELQAKLDQRRSAVLSELLPPQQARAEAFPATRQGLDDGAEWYGSYKAVFLDPPILPDASAVAKAYLTRREAALAKMAPQFRQSIDSAQDASAVPTMYDEVFRLPDDRQTDIFRQLASARTTRAELLTKRAQQAQQAAEEKAEKAALLRGEVVTSSLKIANLENAPLFRALYTGDFAHAGVQRADVIFVDTFDRYLQTFGTSCPASLPADKVQMSEPECKRSVERTVTRGYVVVSRSEECVEWGRRLLDVYADPQAFSAKESLEGAAQSNGVRSFLASLKTQDPLAGTMGQMTNMLGSELSLQKDIPQLIAQNGCGSKALARLEENMTRFASADDPLHLAGFAIDASRMTRAQELNVRGLADDLIRANAAGWFFNQYVRLDRADVDDKVDPQGRARRIHASFIQKGFLSSGNVEISFVDGVPSCLFFSDEPSNCKAASPSVVKRYEDGAYRLKSGR